MPPRNLAEILRHHAASAPARPVLVERDRTLSWAQLDEQVDAHARGLRSLGLPDRARVALALPNSTEYAILYLATLRAGYVAMPINPGYTARELGQLLGESGASLLIGTSDVLVEVASIREDHPGLSHTYTVENCAELALGGGEPVTETTGDDDLAVLLYTSGSSGRPKGAMLSHRALLANHAQLRGIEPPVIAAQDVVLLSVPLFHAYGLNSGLGAVIFHGATGVLTGEFDPAATLALIAEQRITTVLGVPAMFRAWSMLPDFASVFAGVRVAVCGAAPLSEDIDETFRSATGKPIFIGYGLTETAPVLTTTLASPVAKPGSIGRAIPGVEIKLVGAGGDEVWASGDVDVDDFDDDASGSPGTDPGEIVVRGANLFSGYWPDGREGPDPDGWWATGDIAYADRDGDLFLVDRLHELIIVNGFNVYPLEIEQVLAAHPAVVEAAVIGVPNEATGAAIKAYAVLESSVSEIDLLAYCRRNLAKFKCPAAIEFVEELPHSATGKVRKGALRSGEHVDV